MGAAGRRLILAWLLPCLVLAACGAAPPRANPLAEQAEHLRRDGGKAYARQDYANAVRHFAVAAQLHASIDDLSGAAQDRLNLAQALAAAGDSAAAQTQLDAVLAQAGELPGASRAEAARQKAVLALGAGRHEEAAGWQQQAARDCAADCPLAASLALIRAQVALRRGDSAAAAGEVGNAKKLLGGGDPPTPEKANAARLGGEIALQRGDWAQARTELQQALALDRRLGLAGRVRLDLRLLAAAAEASADLPASRAAYQRLLQAAEAGGDGDSAEFARAALARLRP